MLAFCASWGLIEKKGHCQQCALPMSCVYAETTSLPEDNLEACSHRTEVHAFAGSEVLVPPLWAQRYLEGYHGVTESWRVIWSRRVNPQHPHTSCGRWSLVRGESGLVMTSKEYNCSMENANMSEFVPINVIPTIWSIASVQRLGDESSLFLLCVRSCPSGGGRNCSKHDNPLIVHPVVFCIFYLCKTLSSS